MELIFYQVCRLKSIHHQSFTNCLETANSTLIKFPIHFHLVHKLRYLVLFKGNEDRRKMRLSRQFCSKTVISKKNKKIRNRRKLVSSDCSKIAVEKSRCHDAGGCNGVVRYRNAFLFGITQESTRGKAFTLPHRGEKMVVV